MKKLIVSLLLLVSLLGTAHAGRVKLFAANVKTKVYHELTCYKVKEISDKRIMYFASLKGVKQLKYKACKICKPPEK